MARQATRLLPVLLLLVLFSPLGIDIYLPSLPEMAVYFNTSPALVQYSLSIFLLSMGLGQLLVGPMVDRFGRRPVALWGICLYAVCALLATQAPRIESLLGLRFIQGFGACSATVVAYAVVRDRFAPAEGARMLSYLNGSLNVAPALAPLIGGLLAVQFGWQACFWFLVVFAIPVWLMVWFGLPETRPELKGVDYSQPQVSALRRYREILADADFRFYSSCCFAAMAIIITFVSFAPIVLRSELGLGETEFATLFGMNALANMLASFMAPLLIRKLGRHGCVLLGLGMMLCGGAIMLIEYLLAGPSAWGFMVPVMIGSSGFAMLMGSASSFALARFAHCAGAAAALLGCIQMMVASMISMVAVQSALPTVVTMALVMLLCGGVPMIWALLRSRGQPAETAAPTEATA